jgi:DNA-binding GntR family transcriptional regulator
MSAGGAATLATSVYERLRADILSGALAPGVKLKVERLVERYEAGASPVREALNRLSAEGLVDRRDQRGFTVARAGLEDLRELVETRCLIEGLALERSIARRTALWEEGVVLALHRLSRTPRSIETGSYRTNPEWEARHRALHASLIAASGSARLERFAADLRDQADRYRQIAAAAVYPRRHEADEHRAIVDAAIEGRAADAVALLGRHYRTTLAIIEAYAADLFGG